MLYLGPFCLSPIFYPYGTSVLCSSPSCIWITAITFQYTPLPGVPPGPSSAITIRFTSLKYFSDCFTPCLKNLLDLPNCTFQCLQLKLSLQSPFLYMSFHSFSCPLKSPFFFPTFPINLLIISSPVITFILPFNQPTGFLSVPPAYETGLGKMRDVWEENAGPEAKSETSELTPTLSSSQSPIQFITKCCSRLLLNISLIHCCFSIPSSAFMFSIYLMQSIQKLPNRFFCLQSWPSIWSESSF